jgi:UDP-N-acetylglucosamine--N-acetylmuramyl-(pentapeptide) pyrophosphoryl-undecaprenol N-acetylglucosamine transferase
MVKRVCLVSSGTGGHLLPAVVLADALGDQGHEPVLVLGGRAVENAMLAHVRCPSALLPLAGNRLGLPLRLLRATHRARQILRHYEVDVVLVTGGRTSVPVGLAARSLGLPMCLLEQNATTGVANRLLLPLARRIYLGLPTARKVPRSLFTGTPIRREFRLVDRHEARRRLSLRSDVPVVLVTGGSQGAEVLNRVVPPALCGLRRPLQVLHVTGEGNDDAVRSAYLAGGEFGLEAHVRTMVMDMADLYGSADLVICRGGGGTVAELMAVGRPAIIVPYPHHRDRQQEHNGKVLSGAGAAVVVDQGRLDAVGLEIRVRELLADPDGLEAMGRRARGLSPTNPCARIMADMRQLEALD